MSKSKYRIIMHAHHEDSLFSFLPSLKTRVSEIKRFKPADEQGLRLALIQDVTDLLPEDDARQAFENAWRAFRIASEEDDARQEVYKDAQQAFSDAKQVYNTSFDVDAFHARHCHPKCPWDGQTIFAKGTSVSVLGAEEEKAK